MLAPSALDLPTALPVPGAAACPTPRQPPAPRPGQGRLTVACVDGQSAVIGCLASSPLQLLVPRPRGEAAWILAASHGGGLVAGDAVELELAVGPGATASLGTQAETKVYRAGGGPRPHGAGQRLRATVGDGALLALLPDPVSPYAGSRYDQVQAFALAPGGSLALLDAVTAGRVARGERWGLARYRARNEVRVGDELVLADALRLEAGQGAPLAERLGGLELLATVVLLGPRLAPAARELLARLSTSPAAADGPVLAAASPVRDGLVLRIAARSVEAGMDALRAYLSFLAAPLDGDPLLRRP
jgi:urease accessory protein